MAGIGGDQAGWFTVLECQELGEHLTQETPGPPLERIAQLLADSEIPGLRAQVLTHTVLPPAVAERASALGVPSYSPAEVVTWVVLRLDAQALAQEARSAEVSPPEILLAVTRRLENLLKRSTRTLWRVLDAEGLTLALTRSCGLDGVTAPVEELDRVKTGSLQQVTFWVRSWPKSGEPWLLLNALSLVPAAFVSVSILLEPDGEQARLRCLVRVAAGGGNLDAAVSTMLEVAEQLEADLMRLDAEHGPALYASAPSGGGIG
nr:type VII secretion protein EccE [Kineosporia babensis]